jgi:L-lactate dehydrogenase complex protein LldG
MSARDQILTRIRKAAAAETHPVPPPPRIAVPASTAEAKAGQFLSALQKLNAHTHHAASPEDARAYAAALSARRPAVASNAPLLAELGITTLPGVTCGFRSSAPLRQACANASLGITCADYALADTGTLVMLSSQDEARMISLLPPEHLAIVPASRLLTGLDELFTRLPKPAVQSSSMVFITGPSRTADIEQILVRGVHGPGEVHVVLL